MKSNKKLLNFDKILIPLMMILNVVKVNDKGQQKLWVTTSSFCPLLYLLQLPLESTAIMITHKSHSCMLATSLNDVLVLLANPALFFLLLLACTAIMLLIPLLLLLPASFLLNFQISIAVTALCCHCFCCVVTLLLLAAMPMMLSMPVLLLLAVVMATVLATSWFLLLFKACC